ncbi:flagellar hook-associated protein FlgK [Anaerosporobacter faecicola]|uniref:flagellar hook-associated protein FlgK n=1 Tax=Anaerosporobacter faecicola TaxID=2718714 RepID=UPI00143B345E|nr:flagellar hook-associated protein FlgK [Anaerosporobacter faecicola]
MASTFFGLNIGLSGLYAYQASINTTAHNISNAETEGYTRQSLITQASDPLRVYSSYGMVGTGVDIVDIIQQRDAYYDTKYRNASSLYGEYATKNDYMGQIQNYFNETNDSGFTDCYNNLFTSLKTLYDDPTDNDKRVSVSNNAQAFTEFLNNMYNSMKIIQNDANFQIKNQIDRINSYSTQIANLTQQINTLEVTGVRANDLRDAREVIVDKLSELVNVTTEERIVKSDPTDDNEPGQVLYEVRINGQMLVDSEVPRQLEVRPRTEKINDSDVDGLYDVYWANGSEFSLNNANLKGSLAALFQVRDGNNRENFTGVADGDAGSTSLTVTLPSCDDITKLTLPSTGNITIAGKDYAYKNFTITKDASGAYTYTFEMKEALAADVDAARMSVGQSVDYKGVPYYLAKLNEFSRQFASVFNKIHNTGEDLNGDAGADLFNCKVAGEEANFDESATTFSSGFATDATGSPILTGGYVNVSYYLMNAGNIKVADKIVNDPSTFAAAEDISQGVENKAVLKELLNIESDKTLFKAGTPAHFYNSIVGEVSVDASKYESFEKSQTSIRKSIKNQRLSVAGVDTDEEAMNLVKYQNAYNLSAKVIQTMNEIYDKLVNGLGV